jgi:WD40 repeat protein
MMHILPYGKLIIYFFQLLRGRTIVTETVPEKEEVTSCMLSNCGRFLVYGFSDGLVKLFEVESSSTSVIIRFGSTVHYLQVCCNNGFTVIAADEDKSLKVSALLQQL